MVGGKHLWLRGRWLGDSWWQVLMVEWQEAGDGWVEDVWLIHEWQKSGWVVLGDGWFI